MNNSKCYITIIFISFSVAIIFSQFLGGWIVYSGLILFCISNLFRFHLASTSQNNSLTEMHNGETGDNIHKIINFLIKLHNIMKTKLQSFKDNNSQIQRLINNSIDGPGSSFKELKNESNQQKDMDFELVKDVSNESDNSHTIKRIAINAAENTPNKAFSISELRYCVKAIMEPSQS